MFASPIRAMRLMLWKCCFVFSCLPYAGQMVRKLSFALPFYHMLNASEGVDEASLINLLTHKVHYWHTLPGYLELFVGSLD